MGREYEIANGDTIPCLGQKQIVVLTLEGTLRGYNSNCADVAFGKSLQRVRAFGKSGHAVCFNVGPEGKDHLIMNRRTGEVNELKDDGVNYIQELPIVLPDHVNSAQEMLNIVNSGNMND